MLMSSNCSTSSMISFCLLIFTTIAACPALRRANLNLRSAALSSCGISTVWDCSAAGRGARWIQEGGGSRGSYGHILEHRPRDAG